jgi:hypothetical protein
MAYRRDVTAVPSIERQITMLYTIAVILIIMWLLGMVSSVTMGGFIHVLLVVALVVILVNFISGRRLDLTPPAGFKRKGGPWAALLHSETLLRERDVQLDHADRAEQQDGDVERDQAAHAAGENQPQASRTKKKGGPCGPSFFIRTVHHARGSPCSLTFTVLPGGEVIWT